MKLTSQPATKFSGTRHHDEYGIYTFFQIHHIKDEVKQSELIEKFLENQKFKSGHKAGNLKAHKLSFISQRFNKFKQFVKQNA